MERYTFEVGGFIVAAYLTNFQCVVSTQRKFRRYRLVSVFFVQIESTIYVAKSSRLCIVHSEENIAAVTEDVRENFKH